MIVGQCFSCGMKGVNVSEPPQSRCVEQKLCAWRRSVRARTGKLPLIRTTTVLIELHYYGSAYFVQTFGAKSSDVNFVINPPRYYFQAVLERSAATVFKPWEAEPLALHFNGKIVDK